MKKFTLAPAVIAVLIASSSASVCFAQTARPLTERSGTGVGGLVSASESGTNVGGSEDGIDIYSMNPWDSGIQDAITNTKESATSNFADGDVETAIKIYALELEQISKTASQPELQASWTKKIADRAIALASSLDANITNPNDRVALFNVYATTYDLIEEFYTTMDLAYIIPYKKNGQNKDYKIDLPGYEQQLNRYILRQGKWFAERFVSPVSNDYGTLPKYSPTIFLVALSSLSQGLADDLITDSVTGPNLFPHEYEATAHQLRNIAQKINNHLAGGSVYSKRDDRAVNYSYKSFLEVMSSIKVQ